MSNIDPSKPEFGVPTTQSIRDNFAIAKSEIEALAASSSLAGGFIGDGTGAVVRTLNQHANDVVTAGDYATAQLGAVAGINKVYHVPASANVTLTVGSDVASWDLALVAVSQWTIPNTATVTIILPSGATARTTPVVINHPYGGRIKVTGAASVTTTATAAGAVTGAAGAWAVPLTVASGAGIAVGDYALVRLVNGTGVYRIFAGIHRVAAVAGNLVTVTNTARNVAWPAATLTAATLTVVKTRIVFTACDGIEVDGPVGGLSNMVLIGDKTGGTIGLISQRMSQGLKGKGFVYCDPLTFGVSSFGDGGLYAQYNGTIDAAGICVADCNVYNILGQHGGSVNANSAISSGGREAGFAATSGGDVSAQNAIACGNGTYGYFALPGGHVLVQDCFAWGNVSDGLRVAWGGAMRGNTINSQFNGANGIFAVEGDIVAALCVASNNLGAGLYAEGGRIYASNGVASNNGSFGAFADGGLIDAPALVAASNAVNAVTATNNGTILVDGLTGTGSGTYQVSAGRGGTVRATNAVSAGQTMFSDTGGLIDATGATGTPTLIYGPEGIIISASIAKRGSILLDSGSNFAIGATNTAGLNVDKAANSFARFARGGTLKAIFGIDDGASLVAGAAAGDTVIRAEQTLWFTGGGSGERGFIDANGSAGLGRAGFPTASTDGFFYIPAAAGPPTGIPTVKTGRVPVAADSTGGVVYAYIAGAWRPLTTNLAAPGVFTTIIASDTIAVGATSSAGYNVDKPSNSFLRVARGGALKAMFGADDGGTLVVGAAAGDAIIRAEQSLWFAAGGSGERGFIDANGSAALGKASLAPGATSGDFYIPASAGAPAAPPAAKTGRVAVRADSTNNAVYAYLGGAWVGLTSNVGAPGAFTTVTASGTMTANGAFVASGAVSGAGITAWAASPPPIGATAPNTGAFTALSVSGVLTANGTFAGTGFTSWAASPPAIGGTAPNTGAFTALSVSGILTASGSLAGAAFSNWAASPPAIGGTAPAAGAFTSLSSSGAFVAAGTIAGPGFALWAASPPPIGFTAPNTGAFTSLAASGVLSANGTISGGAFTLWAASPPAIGLTIANTGAFTTLSASSTLSGAGFTAWAASPPPIGSAAPSTGAFTTLSASGTVSGAGFTSWAASPPPIGTTAPAAGAFTTLSASGVLTASATIAGAGFTLWAASPPSIGNTAPASGAFTTLSATGLISGAGFTAWAASPPAIGATTPAAGAFTALSASGVLTASGTIAGAGFTSWAASPPAIGSTAPGTGAFTTLSATSTLSGAGFTGWAASPPPIGATAANTGAFTTLFLSGNFAIGATNSASFNMDKASSVSFRLAKGGTLGTLFGIDDGSSLVAGAASGDTVIRAAASLWFAAGGSNERGFIDANGSGALGRASLGTAATDGFFYIPSCAGPPTGVPSAKAGRVPLVADATNGKIYAYLGAAWAALN